MFAYRTWIFVGSIALSLSFVGGPTIHAQTLGSVSGIELTTSNESPAPGQSVTITARSYSGDINSATVTWSVDGKVVQKSTGLTTLTLNAPEIGKKTNIVVTAVMSDGRTFQKTLALGSAAIDMIIETDGYTHPFFSGKIPPAYQNKVTFIAVPHLANSAGVEYDPKTLLFTWKKNDKVLESQSGYGKQSLVLIGDLVPRDYYVSVDVKTRDGSAKGTGFAPVAVTSPTVAFYLDDPLYGPFFNRSLNDSVSIGREREIRILGIPLGFSRPDPEIENLSYTWTINNSVRPELSDNKSIVLRAPADVGGTANIALDIKHLNSILQIARDGFSVAFRKQEEVINEAITF